MGSIIPVMQSREDERISPNLADGSVFNHRTQFYYTNGNALVCSKHAPITSHGPWGPNINVQSVSTFDFEKDRSLKPICLLCKDGAMYGLKPPCRRNGAGYEEFLSQAAEWTDAGLKFVGECPICHGPMLDDGGSCDPFGPCGVSAICHLDGAKVKTCYDCAQTGENYKRIMAMQ